ncbi:MAG: replication-relaxation family protein [Nitrososphaerales archaeon]
MVRPDGYGLWVEGDRTIAFLLEYDNGTEPLARLADKLPRYGRLFAAKGTCIWVLFSFPGPRREAQARRVLAHPGVPVATAVVGPGDSSADALWLPVGDCEGRRRLIDLGDPSPRLAQ